MKRAAANLMGNVREVWLTCFPNDNKKIIDYLFRNILQPTDTIIEIQDNRVVATVSRVEGAIMMNQRIVSASTIVGAVALPKYQNRGYVNNIMSALIDCLDHSELISLASARDPDLFLDYGFRVLYKRNVYKLTRENIQRITNDGCTFDPSPIDMLKIYAHFMKRFNGYRVKTLQDFEKIKQGINEQGGKITAYYENNEIKGYAIMHIENKIINIGECIYSDSLSLFKLLNVALQQRQTVYLKVSSAEKLGNLFNGATHHVEDYMMMRLNNKELFNRLFNCDISSVDEILLMNDKPFYISEFY